MEVCPICKDPADGPGPAGGPAVACERCRMKVHEECRLSPSCIGCGKPWAADAPPAAGQWSLRITHMGSQQPLPEQRRGAPLLFPPDSPAPPVALASRGRRFLGFWIDGLLLIAGLAPALCGGILAQRESSAALGVALGVCTLGLLFALALAQSALIAARGQSVGKRCVGIRIERVDGRPAGFARGALLRALPGAFAALFLAFLAIFLPLPLALFLAGTAYALDALPIFRPSRQCLHDSLAGTRVVEMT